MSEAPYDLYDDHNFVKEIVVDTLTTDGIDRDLATRLADGDADHPWSDLVCVLRDVAAAYGQPITGTAARDGLRRIVGDLLTSLHADGGADWMVVTDHPGRLLIAHLRRIERDAQL